MLKEWDPGGGIIVTAIAEGEEVELFYGIGV
jgi:hypothetical protein